MQVSAEEGRLAQHLGVGLAFFNGSRELLRALGHSKASGLVSLKALKKDRRDGSGVGGLAALPQFLGSRLLEPTCGSQPRETPSPRGSDRLSVPLRAPGMHVVHIHRSRKTHPHRKHTQEIKGTCMHAFNPSPEEAEAGGFPSYKANNNLV